MVNSKGFSLLEVIIVLTIVGILVAIAASSIEYSVEQSKAQSAENNLLAISAAEHKYFEDYGSYCVTTSNCADSTGHINANLQLTISTNDPFTYNCTTIANTIAYQCAAGDGTDTLTLNLNNTSSAVTCTGPGGNQSYCP